MKFKNLKFMLAFLLSICYVASMSYANDVAKTATTDAISYKTKNDCEKHHSKTYCNGTHNQK